jgi:2,3-bisphosphoglycerate-dependent phosphoglycerate mutase
MKPLLFAIFAVAGILFINDSVSAQATTIILLRHAEKDTSTAGSASMQANPPLSKEGEQRALRLTEVLKDYSPDLIWSTDYTRTKSTVAHLAKKFNKEIQVYNPREMAAFADQLLQQQGKTIVVAGHSNTTPSLVNLLIKEKKYPNLDESVYNQLWIVTVKDGKAEARVVTY